MHRIWLGPPMPEVYVRYGQTWAHHHPGWRHRLWTERELDHLEMRNRDLYEVAEVEAPLDAIRWRADIARLEILHGYGGVYVDTDCEALRPVDELLDHAMFLPQSPNNTAFVTNAVMGASAGHPFLTALLDGLAANAAGYRGQRLVDTVGGKYITRQIAALKPTGVTVLPWWTFAGQSIRDRDRGLPPDLGRAYAWHHYGNTMGRGRAGAR